MRVTLQEALKSKQSTSTHFEHPISENQGRIVKLTVISLLGFIKACCAEFMCLKVIDTKPQDFPVLLSVITASSLISLNHSCLLKVHLQRWDQNPSPQGSSEMLKTSERLTLIRKGEFECFLKRTTEMRQRRHGSNQIYTHITQNLWRGLPSQPTHKQLPMGGALQLANL